MSAASEQRNRTMLRVRDVLDREFDRDLSLTALACAVHLSPDHLIRCFREVFGETPHRYLQRRRVERAMHLLGTTRLDVTDVCLAVGFSSLGTFSSTFTRIVGVPPSAYARARRDLAQPAAPGCFVMAWTRPSTTDASVSRKRQPLGSA